MTEAPLIGPVLDARLHVMSFNMRRAVDLPFWRRADRWSTRAPAVRGLIETELPTVLGLQEARARAVTEVMPRRYRRIGVGRDRRGGGEGTPLLYDDRRVEQIDGGQRALSDRPGSAGSRGWGNVLPRIFVWAEFADRRGGSRFLVVNTHLDHLSPRSRLRSAEAIAAFVAERALPSIVMGDLNAGEGSAPLRALHDARLTDVWDLAEQRLTPPVPTYAGYREHPRGGRRLDWIMVSPELGVHTVGVNTRRFDGRRPSDHRAVQAVVRVDAPQTSGERA